MAGAILARSAEHGQESRNAGNWVGRENRASLAASLRYPSRFPVLRRRPTLGPPELHGHADVSKAVRGEKNSQRVGDYGRLDARVVDEFRRCSLTNLVTNRTGVAFADLQCLAQAQLSADLDKAGISSAGEPEKTDAARIDPRRVGPHAEHEVDRPFDVGRPFDEDRGIVGPAHVPSRVAGMIDRDGDETDLGQRLGRVVVTQELAAPAVRDNDERELPASDRTIHGDGQNV